TRTRTTTLDSPVVQAAPVHRGRVLMLLFGIAVVITGAACGSGSADSTFSKVNPDETVRDLDDFSQAGFKKVRDYDVSELPAATGAYLIYFTPPNSEPMQYELRIYPDHAAAIESGVEYAAEVTGKEALLREVDVRWKEGTRDRRGGGAFRDSLTPLYGDYAVFGNVILLCEGRDSAQSLGRCAALLHAAGLGVEG
ncbi:MAG: hypothetical protein J4O07_12415, partial [Chloroflexi bacterium]|nr:hypothetical protein [Chloroflexota bacterium]